MIVEGDNYDEEGVQEYEDEHRFNFEDELKIWRKEEEPEDEKENKNNN